MSDDRIRVLHCLAAVATGGVERRRLILARHLDPKRFEQRVLTREIHGSIAAELERAGVPVQLVGDAQRRLFQLKAIAGAVRSALAFRPHIVHGAVFEALPLAVAAGRATGARIVIEETSYATTRTWRGHSLFRALVAASHACVAISEPVAKYLETRTRVPRAKVTVIDNGVAAPERVAPELRGQIRRGLGLPEDAFVFGTVGRLIAAKRVIDLLKALRLLLDKDPGVRLLIVGEGRDLESLQAGARELQVAEQVVFAGHRDDVGTVFRAMDVFTLASEHEGFGLVLAEAMLSGLPVVATAVGGIPTVVREGETGFLVPPYSPEALAEAIGRLQGDPDLRVRMGEAGRLRAETHFSAERYARDVEAFYRRLLGR